MDGHGDQRPEFTRRHPRLHRGKKEEAAEKRVDHEAAVKADRENCTRPS